MSTLGLSDICDFYVLYAMRTELEQADHLKPAIAKLHEEVEYKFGRIVDAMYPALGQYLYIASFAEARHASHKCYYKIPEITAHGYSREQASEASLQYDPKQAMPHIVTLFKEYNWSGGYGGKRWGDIAEAGRKYFYGLLPPIVFIDHVISIQHNNGRAFSKSSSANLVQWRLNGGISDFLEHYLNARASYDVLDPRSDDYIKRSLAHLRLETILLLRKYWIVVRKDQTIPTWIDAVLTNTSYINKEAIPDPYIIEFGDCIVTEPHQPASTSNAAVGSKPEPKQTFNVGVYSEYIKQHGEQDREGNVLHVCWWSQDLPPGKYVIVETEG